MRTLAEGQVARPGPEVGRPLADALRAAGMEVDLGGPASLPLGPDELRIAVEAGGNLLEGIRWEKC